MLEWGVGVGATAKSLLPIPFPTPGDLHRAGLRASTPPWVRHSPWSLPGGPRVAYGRPASLFTLQRCQLHCHHRRAGPRPTLCSFSLQHPTSGPYTNKHTHTHTRHTHMSMWVPAHNTSTATATLPPSFPLVDVSLQLALLRNYTLISPPGTSPSYSNAGFAFLGR